MEMMEWVRKRVVEPSTWAAMGVGAIVMSMMLPAWAMWFWCVAAVTVVAGIVMKERAE